MRTLIGIVACLALLAPVSASAMSFAWDHPMVANESGDLQLDKEHKHLRKAWKAVWEHNQQVGMKQMMAEKGHLKQIAMHKQMQRGMKALHSQSHEQGINPVPEPSAALVFAAGAMIASARLRRRKA